MFPWSLEKKAFCLLKLKVGNPCLAPTLKKKQKTKIPAPSDPTAWYPLGRAPTLDEPSGGQTWFPHSESAPNWASVPNTLSSKGTYSLATASPLGSLQSPHPGGKGSQVRGTSAPFSAETPTWLVSEPPPAPSAC